MSVATFRLSVGVPFIRRGILFIRRGILFVATFRLSVGVPFVRGDFSFVRRGSVCPSEFRLSVATFRLSVATFRLSSRRVAEACDPSEKWKINAWRWGAGTRGKTGSLGRAWPSIEPCICIRARERRDVFRIARGLVEGVAGVCVASGRGRRFRRWEHATKVKTTRSRRCRSARVRNVASFKGGH